MKRTAIIYRPSKTAMQSGRSKTKQWILEFSTDDRKFIDAIMGWIGSKDTTRQIKIPFESKEDAMRYAKENSLDFTIKVPHERKIKPKSYADNFAHDARRYSDLSS